MPNPGEMAGETGEAHQSQMRTLLGQDPPRPWPTPMAPTDGSNGTEASDCVGVPPVRLCDRRRATAVDPVLEGALARCGRRRAIKTCESSGRVGLSPGARNTTQTAEQSSAQAHSSCEQGPGQRARSSAQAGGGARGATRAARRGRADTQPRDTHTLESLRHTDDDL